VAFKKESKRDQLLRLAAERSLTRIDESAAAALRKQLDPISDSTFRRTLRESGLPLSPLVEGVRQDNLEELERTLLQLLDELPKSRQAVITAKDHARMAERRAPQPHRQEAILWMTVWLENPPLFREWLVLRKAIAARPSPP
jgi:hypothetical protein